VTEDVDGEPTIAPVPVSVMEMSELDTPALVVDLDILRRNIEAMAAVAHRAGVRLRPHTKTHKCPEIARMQVEAGASGITVAKLGEAEVMADAGFDDILVAYPIVGEQKLGRLRALRERARVRVSLDSVEVAEGLGTVGTASEPLEVLIEVDTGHHRMGRPPGEPTAVLAAEIARVAGIEVMGLLSHAGHAYRAEPGDLEEVAAREAVDLAATAEACARAGVEIREISVGSTPTAGAVASAAGVTESRPGTYVFNDVQQMRLGVATQSDCAARLLATVVARPWEDRFVIDAGSKSLSSDGGDGPPFPGRGVLAGRDDLMLDLLTEEHGVGHVLRGGGQPTVADPAVGDRLQVIPLHVCSCVNLFDTAAGVRDGRVERELVIAGRGKVR
jgi:D-serine deaminase-like pyridoxal phosphate-dependent protein